MSKQEKIWNLIDYIINKIHSCPFEDESGVDFNKCVGIDEEIAGLIRKQHPDEFAFGDFTPGRYAWVMEEAELFKKPVPATGKQGLWDFPGGYPGTK